MDKTEQNTTLGDENSESLAYVNIKTVSSADIQGDKRLLFSAWKHKQFLEFKCWIWFPDVNLSIS